MAGFGAMAYPDFRRSENIEDRRDEDYSSVKWENVPPTLRDLAVSIGNKMWGTPQIPEAPSSPLSDALGKRDIKTEPSIGRSSMERAIDDTQIAFNVFGIGKGDSWANKLTADGSFSRGFGSLASPLAPAARAPSPADDYHALLDPPRQQ